MEIEELLKEIRTCNKCSSCLPLGPAPLLTASSRSRIVVIGQAPGVKAHESRIPWNDASGKQLRKWMGVSDEVFYNPEIIALVPMGFCYPGKGKSGDLPPRPECALSWHEELQKQMPNKELILLVGNYAQRYYLKGRHKNLTETVKSYHSYLPQFFPIVHPSPNSRFWLSKNRWFVEEVVPVLQQEIQKIIKR
ncbi:uracil-DNA glycosylase family protein [Rubrolithibacter danxiaensis]|uniref:uracil-DNA glycosylase family protein n=1 Tax=Rubrolithibacter danxiaensis TaxID=3390805 RepID=UPI003BF8C9E2